MSTNKVLASSVYLPLGRRHKQERNGMLLGSRIGFRNGYLPTFENEKPKKKALPAPTVECTNEAALYLCMRWELQDKLDALIQESRTQEGIQTLYMQLRILQSHLADMTSRFGLECSDSDMLLARKMYQQNKREVTND